MADTKKNAASDDGAPPPKKTKLLLIIIVAALAVVIAVVAVLVLLMQPSPEEEELEEAPPAKVAPARPRVPAGPPTFAKLDPFVVRVQSEGPEAYVQAVPELKMLTDPVLAEQLKLYMPEIRHRVLLILAGKQATELVTPAGMQTLANQIRESINSTLTGEPVDQDDVKLDSNPRGPVMAVFFSSLIVQ